MDPTTALFLLLLVGLIGLAAIAYALLTSRAPKGEQ